MILHVGDRVIENNKEEEEKEGEDSIEEETVDALTTYFRRTSRGRIVDLPRWVR